MSLETIYQEKEVRYKYWINRKIIESMFLFRLQSVYIEIR